jgi:hypothetical protein
VTLEEIIQADKQDRRFTVDGYRGIAFYFVESETVADEDTYWTGYEVETGNAVMVMVGDDRKHSIDPDEVTELADDAYCPECGQIGCTAYRLVEWNQ